MFTDSFTEFILGDTALTHRDSTELTQYSGGITTKPSGPNNHASDAPNPPARSEPPMEEYSLELLEGRDPWDIGVQRRPNPADKTHTLRDSEFTQQLPLPFGENQIYEADRHAAVHITRDTNTGIDLCTFYFQRVGLTPSPIQYTSLFRLCLDFHFQNWWLPQNEATYAVDFNGLVESDVPIGAIARYYHQTETSIFMYTNFAILYGKSDEFDQLKSIFDSEGQSTSTQSRPYALYTNLLDVPVLLSEAEVDAPIRYALAFTVTGSAVGKSLRIFVPVRDMREFFYSITEQNVNLYGVQLNALVPLAIQYSAIGEMHLLADRDGLLPQSTQTPEMAEVVHYIISPDGTFHTNSWFLQGSPYIAFEKKFGEIWKTHGGSYQESLSDVLLDGAWPVIDVVVKGHLIAGAAAADLGNAVVGTIYDAGGAVVNSTTSLFKAAYEPVYYAIFAGVFVVIVYKLA